MPYNPAASVQGVSLRVTKLDESGNLLNGPTDSYLTTAFIRVSFTPEYEEGDEITEKAADGTVCVSFKAPDTLKRVNMEIAICDPDPEVSALLSGGLLLSSPEVDSAGDPTGAGDVTRGWASAQVGEDPSGNGVAVEVWSRAIQDGKPAGTNPYFHWIFPYVKTRLSGDRVIENGLMATTFEGFGLGNINFRNGPDGAWMWPAATDRPYLYARTSVAPQGLRGFFTYDAPSTTPGDAPSTPTSTPTTFDNVSVGINVKGSKNPYPYDAAQVEDNLLSSDDYTPDATGSLTWEASADKDTVTNAPPAAPAVQNPVTYKDRGNPDTGDPVYVDTYTPPTPVAITGVTQGSPGSFQPENATLPDNVDDLNDDDVVGVGGTSEPGTMWTSGEYVLVGSGAKVYWDGSAWAVGEAP
jgi:hypothetical protein